MKQSDVKILDKTMKESTPSGTPQLGNICMHDNVISNLVRRSALAVPGVSRLSGSSLVDNIAELVGSRKMQDRAIAILKSEEDSSKITIEIKINIFFGFKVQEIAETVQRKVIESVENTANVTVLAVNVAIQEIEEEPKPEEDAAEQDSAE